MNRYSLKQHLIPSHIYMTSHYARVSVTTLHDFGGVLGRCVGHLLLGSYNLMVTALGSCAKWPLSGLVTSSIFRLKS